MKNVFSPTDTAEIVNRINKLTPATQPLWGKMNVAQMLAHCNVTYEMVYTDKHPEPNAFKKFILKLILKPIVTNEKPYKHNSQTAPWFKITDARNVETEKNRLIDHLNKTRELGEAHFHNKESHSFGPLTAKEWNNMFYKHLDHHLRQFGV